MAYLGNTPTSQNFTSGTDYFNGNGSTVAFTLSRQVSSINDVIVVIENVVQKPLDAYSIVGTTLTFTSAPPSGTNNIYVRYISTITTAITPNDLSVTTNKIADGVVTTAKVADNHITVAKLHTTVLQPANISDKENTSTGYLGLPKGTTAERPASPHAGMSRFNTTTGYPEWYSALLGAWINFADAPYSVEYLVVAGGGAGGTAGGGGGAGGLLTGSVNVFVATSYTVTVGGGGSGGVLTWGASGNPGSNSVFSSITALGGGSGGHGGGGNGGSGGGGAQGNGGSGTAGQGNAGGNGNPTNSSYPGGGGGGASAVGANASGRDGGAGGNGSSSSISGSSVTYAGGGGGGTRGNNGGSAGAGGSGGGGAGGATGNGTSGTTNTGGGGGGSGGENSGYSVGAGGSGIVIIRYTGSQRGTGGTVTSSGGYTIHTFTSSSTFTA